MPSPNSSTVTKDINSWGKKNLNNFLPDAFYLSFYGFLFSCWNCNFFPQPQPWGCKLLHCLCTDRMRIVTLTCAKFWTGSPTEPRCRLKHLKSDMRSRARRHTPSLDSCPDARARPRSPRCPSPTPPWWRRWNRTPGTGRRGWSSSSEPHSRGPWAVRTGARRSLGWSRPGRFYPPSRWPGVKRRTHNSSHHHDGLVQCISETPFWFCVAKVETKSVLLSTTTTCDVIYIVIYLILILWPVTSQHSFLNDCEYLFICLLFERRVTKLLGTLLFFFFSKKLL